ncbi:hypothetical protein [Lentzea guizhouensis]|nr:hypothetical protein [Lentzea guizhouensis]
MNLYVAAARILACLVPSVVLIEYINSSNRRCSGGNTAATDATCGPVA